MLSSYTTTIHSWVYLSSEDRFTLRIYFRISRRFVSVNWRVTVFCSFRPRYSWKKYWKHCTIIPYMASSNMILSSWWPCAVSTKSHNIAPRTGHLSLCLIHMCRCRGELNRFVTCVDQVWPVIWRWDLVFAWIMTLDFTQAGSTTITFSHGVWWSS